MAGSSSDFISSTIDLEEAARFLGFKNTERLRQKAKRGDIPGAFKIGLRWMFHLPRLEDWVSNLYATYGEASRVGIKESKLCQSAKRKIARSTTLASQSAESEYKNLRAQLLNQKRKGTKKNAEKR